MQSPFFLAMTALLASGLSFSSVEAAREKEACVQRETCDGASVCASSEDLSSPGLHPVGARTLEVKGLRVEVWYPAQTSPGAPRKTYDVRSALPPLLQALIPASKAPIQSCDCYDSLALDRQRGPYPLVVFAHGSASFRTQSLSLMTHLASRGFVVVAADHRGLQLSDYLQGKREADVVKDLRMLLEGLDDSQLAESELSFLKGAVQLDRIGLVGHSAGGGAIQALASTPGVRLLVPMAAGGGAREFSGASLILGALDDKVVPFSRQEAAFEATVNSSRLIGISNAGHLAFADLCQVKNADGQDLVAIAEGFGLPSSTISAKLWDGCAAGQLDVSKSMEIVRYAVTASAESALQCQDRSQAFELLPYHFPEVGLFIERRINKDATREAGPIETKFRWVPEAGEHRSARWGA